MPALSLDTVVGVRGDDDAYGTGEAVDEAEAEAELVAVVVSFLGGATVRR